LFVHSFTQQIPIKSLDTFLGTGKTSEDSRVLAVMEIMMEKINLQCSNRDCEQCDRPVNKGGGRGKSW
jgi:hypothetical protein